MYDVKNRIYLSLDKTQKSALCNYLRALVKKSPEHSAEEICIKFLEDERYYLEMKSSRLPFLEDFINDRDFLRDTEVYIAECIKYYEYKKSKEPFIQAQKEFDKKKRKFLQEVKMSKELPTKKQISYYNSLCKRYGKDKVDTNGLSKLDLRNMIDGIINENERN